MKWEKEKCIFKWDNDGKKEGRILLIFNPLEASCSEIWETACPHFGKWNIIRRCPGFRPVGLIASSRIGYNFLKSVTKHSFPASLKNEAILNSVYKVKELSPKLGNDGIAFACWQRGHWLIKIPRTYPFSALSGLSGHSSVPAPMSPVCQ